jgi:hypothetical protein
MQKYFSQFSIKVYEILTIEDKIKNNSKQHQKINFWPTSLMQRNKWVNSLVCFHMLQPQMFMYCLCNELLNVGMQVNWGINYSPRSNGLAVDLWPCFQTFRWLKTALLWRDWREWETQEPQLLSHRNWLLPTIHVFWGNRAEALSCTERRVFFFKDFLFARSQCLMPVILASQEAEIRRIEMQGLPGQIVCKTLS